MIFVPSSSIIQRRPTVNWGMRGAIIWEGLKWRIHGYQSLQNWGIHLYILESFMNERLIIWLFLVSFCVTVNRENRTEQSRMRLDINIITGHPCHPSFRNKKRPLSIFPNRGLIVKYQIKQANLQFQIRAVLNPMVSSSTKKEYPASQSPPLTIKSRHLSGSYQSISSCSGRRPAWFGRW